MLILLVAATSAAQPDSASEADRLFEEGRAFAKEKRYSEACERFTRSYAIDPSIGTQLNLGDCKDALGQYREAWLLFTAAADHASRTGDDRAAFARKRAKEAAARLATIVIELAEPTQPGLALTIAGRSATPASEVRDVADPGAITIVASAPGRSRFETTVTGAAGETVRVSVPALDAPAAAAPRDRGRVRIAWILAGVGGLSALSAVVLTTKARSDYNKIADGPECQRSGDTLRCNDVGTRRINDAQRLADVSTGVLVVGGVFVAAAAIVYVTAPRANIAVSPSISEASVGAVLTTSF